MSKPTKKQRQNLKELTKGSHNAEIRKQLGLKKDKSNRGPKPKK